MSQNVSFTAIDGPACSFRIVTDDPEQLTIHLAGRLDENCASSLIRKFELILKEHQPKVLVVELAGLDSLDDFGVAALVGLKKQMSKIRGTFELAGVNDEIAEVLTMHQFSVLGLQRAPDRRPPSDIFTQFGDFTIRSLIEMKFMLHFLGDSCFSFVRILKNPRSLRFNDTVANMQKVGADALPIVGLISFLLGLIMAFMSAVQLQQFGANIYVASLVGLSMTRELGPIMTAIIVAGRSGSAFAAEIGSMKISEEVDALYTMGLDPHLFLVMPRLVAAFLVVPFLTLFSDLFAILGGLFVGISMLDLTVSGYVNQTINTLSMFDVFWGFGKSAIFALLIAWTGCLRGFQVRGGAAGVGRATTSAVVSSIFLIIVCDSIFVVILRYWE